MSPKVHPTHCTGFVSALRRVGRATAATGVILCCSWCGVAMAQSGDGNSATEVQVQVLIEALLDFTVPLVLHEPQADTVLQLVNSGADSTTQVQVVIGLPNTAAEFTLRISVDDAEVVSVSSETIALTADGDAVRRSVQFELTAEKVGETTLSLVVTNNADGATAAERVVRVIVRDPVQILSPMKGTQIVLVRGDGTLASSQVEVVIKPGFPDVLSVQLDDVNPSPVLVSTTSPALTASADGNVRTRFTMASVEAGNTTLTLVVSDRLGSRDTVVIRVSVRRVKIVCESCLVPDTVIVPSGSFTMGSPADEEDREFHEGSQHSVSIDYTFAVGQYELTRGQYRAFVDANPRYDASPNSLSAGPTDAHPVIFVSWGDAKAYLSWLSEETGEEWRLLSESEWEYAARARTTTSYYFGDTISTTQAAFARTPSGSRLSTVAVGSYPANTFGLHDMHGNVWELVADCWHYGYDAFGDFSGAPADGSAWVTNCAENDRVQRGGAWNSEFDQLRSAARGRYTVGDRINNLGFRVARSLNP